MIMSSKKKKPGPKSKKNSKLIKESKCNQDVLILPPNLLQKLGIDLENLQFNQSRTVCKNGDIPLEKERQLEDHVTKNAMDSKTHTPKNDSILETANLMTTSVFLSPTFHPVVTSSNVINGEIEFVQPLKNNDKNNDFNRNTLDISVVHEPKNNTRNSEVGSEIYHDLIQLEDIKFMQNDIYPSQSCKHIEEKEERICYAAESLYPQDITILPNVTSIHHLNKNPKSSINEISTDYCHSKHDLLQSLPADKQISKVNIVSEETLHSADLLTMSNKPVYPSTDKLLPVSINSKVSLSNKNKCTFQNVKCDKDNLHSHENDSIHLLNGFNQTVTDNKENVTEHEINNLLVVDGNDDIPTKVSITDEGNSYIYGNSHGNMTETNRVVENFNICTDTNDYEDLVENLYEKVLSVDNSSFDEVMLERSQGNSDANEKSPQIIFGDNYSEILNINIDCITKITQNNECGNILIEIVDEMHKKLEIQDGGQDSQSSLDTNISNNTYIETNIIALEGISDCNGGKILATCKSLEYLKNCNEVEECNETLFTSDKDRNIDALMHVKFDKIEQSKDIDQFSDVMTEKEDLDKLSVENKVEMEKIKAFSGCDLNYDDDAITGKKLEHPQNNCVIMKKLVHDNIFQVQSSECFEECIINSRGQFQDLENTCNKVENISKMALEKREIKLRVQKIKDCLAPNIETKEDKDDCSNKMSLVDIETDENKNNIDEFPSSNINFKLKEANSNNGSVINGHMIMNDGDSRLAQRESKKKDTNEVVDEIASYLAKCSHVLLNRQKSTNGLKRNCYKRKLSVHGVEKPGGSTEKGDYKLLHDNIAPFNFSSVSKTYKKTVISNSKNVLLPELNQYEIKKCMEEITSSLNYESIIEDKKNEDFCLCEDFGKLTFYDFDDVIKVYQHIHFLEHKSESCNIGDTFFDTDYVKYVETECEKLDLCPKEPEESDNNYERVCWNQFYLQNESKSENSKSNTVRQEMHQNIELKEDTTMASASDKIVKKIHDKNTLNSTLQPSCVPLHVNAGDDKYMFEANKTTENDDHNYKSMEEALCVQGEDGRGIEILDPVKNITINKDTTQDNTDKTDTSKYDVIDSTQHEKSSLDCTKQIPVIQLASTEPESSIQAKSLHATISTLQQPKEIVNLLESHNSLSTNTKDKPKPNPELIDFPTERMKSSCLSLSNISQGKVVEPAESKDIASTTRRRKSLRSSSVSNKAIQCKKLRMSSRQNSTQSETDNPVEPVELRNSTGSTGHISEDIISHQQEVILQNTLVVEKPDVKPTELPSTKQYKALKSASKAITCLYETVQNVDTSDKQLQTSSTKTKNTNEKPSLSISVDKAKQNREPNVNLKPQKLMLMSLGNHSHKEEKNNLVEPIEEVHSTKRKKNQEPSSENSPKKHNKEQQSTIPQSSHVLTVESSFQSIGSLNNKRKKHSHHNSQNVAVETPIDAVVSSQDNRESKLKQIHLSSTTKCQESSLSQKNQIITAVGATEISLEKGKKSLTSKSPDLLQNKSIQKGETMKDPPAKRKRLSELSSQDQKEELSSYKIPKKSSLIPSPDKSRKEDTELEKLETGNEMRWKATEVGTSGDDTASSQKKSVKCGVCLKLLNEELWPAHVYEEHCCIAWKEGEIINLECEELKNNVNKKLQNGETLKCTFCDISSKTCKNFIAHVRKCINKRMEHNADSEKNLQVDNVTADDSQTCDSRIVCGVCKEAIDNSMWSSHLEKSHGYLSWEEGELPLDLNDKDAVSEHLRFMLRQLRSLRCVSCENVFKTVQRYQKHVSKCNVNSSVDKEDSNISGDTFDDTLTSKISENQDLTSTDTSTTELRRKPKRKRDSNSKQSSSTCGVCNKEIETDNWMEHIQREHKYIAWKSHEQPIEVTNEEAVFEHLNNLSKRINGLVCYKCGLNRRYVKVFLRHVETCGETDSDQDSNTDKIVESSHTAAGDQGSKLRNTSGACSDENQDISHTETPTLKLAKKSKRDHASIQSSTTCGVCNKKIEPGQWMEHIQREHKYIAWKSGQKPIDVTDEEAVFDHLNNLSRKINGLVCYKCGLSRRYVKVFLKHTEECNVNFDQERNTTSIVTDITGDAQEDTCGVCSEVVSKKKWREHAMTNHYNIAWRLGDPPIDMNNPYAVEKYIKKYKDVHKKLVCKLCKLSRVSNVGFYGHILVCGKTDEEIDKYKLECDICKQKYLAIYKSQHMTMHREREKVLEQREQAEAKRAESRREADVPPSGRRRAAEKAKSVIEKYSELDNDGTRCASCGFVADASEDLAQHACASANSESDDEQFAADESEESDEDDCSDDEAEPADQPLAKRKRKWKKPSVLPPPPKFPIEVTDAKSYLKRSFKEFCILHFTSDPLFPEWRCDQPTCESPAMLALPEDQLARYLPAIEESCSFMLGDAWTTYKRFEVKSNEDLHGVSVFVGGSPQCLAWAPPLSYSVNDSTSDVGGGDGGNFLAVACHSGPDIPRFNFDEVHSHPGLLQIWDVAEFDVSSVRLALGIAHEWGTVWDMSWCPSGARERLPGPPAGVLRLGLLAVACSDGAAYVLPVPHPAAAPTQNQLYYKIKPVVELRLFATATEERKCQATSISWSKQRGHAIIAVGYADGSIATYDLNSDSPILRNEENGVTVLHPFHDEVVQNSPIIGVDVFPSASPQNVHPSIGAAGALGASLFVRGTAGHGLLTNHQASNGAEFAPLWPMLLVSLEDTLTLLVNELSLSASAPRRVGVARRMGACLRCGVVAQSTTSSVRVMHPHPVHKEVCRKLVLHIDLKPLHSKKAVKSEKCNTDSEIKIEPLTYGDAVKKYGIQLRRAHKSEHVDFKKPIPVPERFPLADTTALAFCSSPKFHRRLAVALHAGIIVFINT